MKKIFTLAAVYSAFALASCAGNANNGTIETVESEQEIEIVEDTVSNCCDSTAVAEAADTVANK